MRTKKQIPVSTRKAAKAVASVPPKAVAPVAAEAAETPNRFTADAQTRMVRLRSSGEEFPRDPKATPLTRREIVLARRTTVEALERAAVFAEAAPQFGVGPEEVAEIRDAIAFELAYAGVRDEAKAFARVVDMAIVQKKKKPTYLARALYEASKGVLKLPVGDPLKPHVSDMKRTLVPARRKKAQAPAPPVEEQAQKK